MDTTPSMKVHNVFHTSLLEPVETNELSGRKQTPPLAIILDQGTEYEVEAILDHKQHYRKTKYLVQWKGYGPEDNTWEPIENLEDADGIKSKPLQEYLRSIQDQHRQPTFA